MSELPRRRPLRIGISACLLGEKVRFDGGHKQDAFLTGTFGRFVEWVPVCPEVEAGLGTPREAMRLVRTQDVLKKDSPSFGSTPSGELRRAGILLLEVA